MNNDGKKMLAEAKRAMISQISEVNDDHELWDLIEFFYIQSVKARQMATEAPLDVPYTSTKVHETRFLQ
jgi:hypothetical protein